MERTQEIKNTSVEVTKNINLKLHSVLTPLGFECHPFKIGWYNEQVGKSFGLPYDYDTLAFVIISTPSMFEKSFIPFVTTENCNSSLQDPLDQCMVKNFSTVKTVFPDNDVVTIHDFELVQNRRPKVLVQTAGHVSGAVRYYQRKDLKSDPWDTMKKIFGVCVHPHYGGWFALRGVTIFADIICPDLEQQDPMDILQSDEKLIDLLRRYNEHWQDWSFRDIIPVKERYSEQQKEYFNTKPGERNVLIEKYRASLD